MIILTIRTDKPEAEIGLFDDEDKLTYETWQAHRQLAETIHTKIKNLLVSQKLRFDDIGGIVCYRGPGSFTGLRIGISVANALAAGLNVPIVAVGSVDWIKNGDKQIVDGANQKIALPEYGAPVRVTTPKK